MLNTKKSVVTMAIQATARSVTHSGPKPPRVSILLMRSPRERFATCVSGRTANATVWSCPGKEASGINVLLMRNIGVIRRNVG